MAFQPFSVQCLTCGSRLRVTDPLLVGQISSCPKCGSMVQVNQPNSNAGAQSDVSPSASTPVIGAVPIEGQLPTPRVEMGSAEVDSEAITHDAISSSDILADSSSHVMPPPLESEVGSSAFQRSNDFPADHTASTPVNDPDFNDGARMSPESWQSERTRKSRQAAMIVAVSAISLLGAIVFFTYFVRSRRSATRHDDASTTVDPTGAKTSQEIDHDNDTTDDAGADNETQPVGDSDPTSVEQQTTPQDTSVSPEEPDKTTSPRKQEAIQDKKASPPQPEVKPTNGMENSIPIGLIPTSPLDDPGSNSSAAPLVAPPIVANPEKPKEEGPNQESRMKALPPALAQYVQLTELGGKTNEFEPNLDAPPSLDETKLDAAAEESLDPMMIATPPPEVNLRRAMAIEFAFDSQGYPLADLILLISQMTGLPIQIDWLSLDLAGIDVRKPIVPDRGVASAESHLGRVASSLDAQLRIEESMVTLTVDNDSFLNKIKGIVDLNDFGDGEESATALLSQFIDPTMNTAQTATPERLNVGETRDDQLLSVLAADCLRRMRGIEPKLSEDTFRRWAGNNISDPETVSHINWRTLENGVAGPPTYTPLTVAGLFRRIARVNNAVCLVSWSDATRRRLSPDQITMPYFNDDAGELLSRTLAPFEMQVRTVDERYWWVGTEASFDRLLVVVSTQKLGKQKEAVLGKIRSAMQVSGVDSSRLMFDESSDQAIMLVPRFLAIQLPKVISTKP